MSEDTKDAAKDGAELDATALPTLDDLHALKLTIPNGMSVEEYIADLRGEYDEPPPPGKETHAMAEDTEELARRYPWRTSGEAHRIIAELDDRLARRDREIAELREQVEEAAKLISNVPRDLAPIWWGRVADAWLARRQGRGTETEG